MRPALLFALLAFISCDPAYAQLPGCEAQLESARAQLVTAQAQVSTCHSRFFMMCETTSCSVPDSVTGLVTCLSEECLPDPQMVPEPGFGVGLVVGVAGLVASTRTCGRRYRIRPRK